ncbi:MAG: hypothetical protein ABGX43_03355, partial [Nitrospinaceae bacterium]
MPKNRIVKAPTNGLTASRDKILASLACYSHTSDWQISLRLLETITPSGADNGCCYFWELKPRRRPISWLKPLLQSNRF